MDLQHNQLKSIPCCLLKLPSLEELNLAFNMLHEIPDVPEWSLNLTVLILSHNQLSSLPINVTAPTIESLNLSHNNFRTVPLSVCSFVTLKSLNLSDNPDIHTLPAEMGRLSMLTQLNLTNLEDLSDPPRNIQKDTRDCIRYLNSKLRCAKGFYRMKLMLVGHSNRGKTTLVKQLKGQKCNNETTIGLEVSEWCYKPDLTRKPFYFRIWDFNGLKEYYAIQQCFLTQRSLYLLLFNLNDGDNGVQELKPWLNNIALRAPHSCVIIIGTHLDEVAEEKREEIDALLQRVGVLAESYSNKLQIVEVMPVGLKNRIENVKLLEEAIYNHAANYKTKSGQVIMGQKIPASYHALDKQLESVQQEVRLGIREPIMHAEEFSTMVQQMNLADIQDEDELKMATLFLTDVGSLLHYDDHGHNLHELYFIDPRWLCDKIFKMVTINERIPLVNNGILYSKCIPQIFKDDIFPWKYFGQYLTLLDRFEIALPLNNRCVLMPCMLPNERPKNLIEDHFAEAVPAYSRYITFNSIDTPPGFWSRLLSKMMFSIPQICYALDKVIPPVLAEDQISANVSSQTKLEKNDPDFHQLIPNFPCPLPSMVEQFDTKELHLEYWKSGLFYKDPQVSFCVESLKKSGKPYGGKNDGILIVISYSNHAKKMIGQLVNLILPFIIEWYPKLAERQHSGHKLEQRVLCYECIKAKRLNPFEFTVDQCLSIINNNHTAKKEVCISYFLGIIVILFYFIP